ncbi:MAG TPA: class I SAM-dependent methyltransferase [Dehalococcoidales bacterium]
MTIKSRESENWNRIALKWPAKGYSNKLLAEHKRKTYLNLIARWADIKEHQVILKTDLFTEAFGQEQFLFDIPSAKNVIGIDVATEIVKRAKSQAELHGIDSSQYFCGDVRKIPLQDNSVDIVISDSTLDHFSSEKDIITSLAEIGRVLRIGGILVLTMDNNHNFTYMPYFAVRLWMKLRMAPYFIGKSLSISQLKIILEGKGMHVEESTAIFHYPHPDLLVRWLERALSKLSANKLDHTIRKSLTWLDKLEGRKTKYLTGRYIAVKATKLK